MSKSSPHALIWSEAQQYYELHTHGQPEQCFYRGDEPAWQSWLAEHSAFAFVGQSGRLSVLKEARSRGSGYWYAYRTQNRHTRKRYLGTTAQVTFARLEEEAKALKCDPPLASLPPQLSPQEKEASSASRANIGQAEKKPDIKSQIEQEGMLLSPKLTHPRLPVSLVERERLLSELHAIRSHPLTLVSASAGSGKTTLLSAWTALSSSSRERLGARGDIEQKGAKPVVAWLSLDERDNDPRRFWISVIAALRTCLPNLGQGASAMLRSPESPPLSTILMALLNEILEEACEIILILDDYHAISDQAIHESVLFWLEHQPAQLHLVLATRTDPELPLSRLRVRGQLIEIRDQELRFTQAETARFLLQGMGLPLSEEDLATLQRRTEGWIAGLQLAALSLRKREDLSAWIADFAGSNRFLLDYVRQEILARLPGTRQQFLLQTSILTRMNASLCQAVTGLPSLQESQEMLEVLEQANLFVVPLDEQRQWYRYHDLFCEALRSRLQASQSELVPLLHIRAARWYEAVGEQREAIVHALAAPDYSLAASLMEQAAAQFWLNGEARTVHAWTLSLPDAILCAHTRLALNAALYLLNSITIGSQTLHASLQAQVERTHIRMEELLRRKSKQALSGAEEVLIGRRLRVLRALIEVTAAIKHGDQERLRLLSLEIEALPQDEETHWNLIPLYFTFWRVALLQGEGASLIIRMLSAKQEMLEAGDSLITIRVMTWLAFAYTQAAQLRLGQQECLEALAMIEQYGARTVMEGYVYHFLFQISYAWNRLEEADNWLRRLQRVAQDWQLIDLLVRGEILSARLALARGDLEAAQDALQQLATLVEQEELGNHFSRVSTLRVQLWLAQDNLVEATTWATQITLSPNAWNPLRKGEALMLVRVSLARQQYAEAIELLERFNQHLDQPGDIDTTIEFLALSVVALHQGKKREQVAHVAARLFALTEPEGYIRVYLDAGSPMQQALKALLRAPQDNNPMLSRSYVLRLLAILEQEAQRPTQGKDATPSQSMPEALIEPLSRQEQRVLHLLIAGQTYAEMAQALIVSPNTIKTQVSSIYRKLGVRRRTEAITLVRQLHLL
ncbi:MAG TPA: LuxR C-terminal-related transcriptional regulator [Ktedonobacteraceae bacterium]|nr:LuxR C-terminal-related transcriptional regulator [Ktedonobacteraceae bacterium]